MLILGEPAADLERRVERLADFERVGAEHVANLVTQPVDLGIRFGHRDDRERQREDPADQQAADLPVAVVPGDEDDAAALREQRLEQLAGLVRGLEQRRRLLAAAATAREGNR